MSQRPARGGLASLVWSAVGCVLITLNAPVFAQSPPSVATDFSASATPALTDAPGPTTNSPTPPSRLGPGSTAISGSDVPTYKLLRYDEDYSYLKDPDRRTDFWDPIKYIPFGDRDDWYASFGAQLRPRLQFYNNFDFGTTPGPNAYLDQRYYYHGDFHFGPNVRIFFQLVDGFENGRIGGPLPQLEEDIFDAHQAFLDMVQHFDEEDSLTWRLGRQEMSYGSGRLIDVLEGVNLRRSFDAVRLLFRLGDWSVDGFWSKPVQIRPGVFDDIPDPQLSLWGVYAVHPLRLLPDGHADLYYLGYENKSATYDKVPPAPRTAYELRNSLGTRLWGQPMPWEYDVEAIWQFGEFGRGNIEAWAVASATRYTFDLPFRPRIGLVADITSGDQNPRLAEPGDLQPNVPHGCISQPRQPHRTIKLHPGAPEHRRPLRPVGDRPNGLGFRLAGKRGRRDLWSDRRPTDPYGATEPESVCR